MEFTREKFQERYGESVEVSIPYQLGPNYGTLDTKMWARGEEIECGLYQSKNPRDGHIIKLILNNNDSFVVYQKTSYTKDNRDICRLVRNAPS